LNILVIEDDRVTSSLIIDYLKKAGFSALSVDSAEKAASCITEAEIELILLDVILPGKTGLDYLEDLKASEQTRSYPVIVMTSLEDDKALSKAYEAGAFDYLRKPLKEIELIARVRSALKFKRELDQRLRNEEALLGLTRLLGEENQSLQLQLKVDSLTGLATRRELDAALGLAWQKARTEQSFVSLIMCDVDNFKKYNDSYGHLAGDECLRRIGRAINSSLSSPEQLAGRYGGEEFAIILPGYSEERAYAEAERIRKKVIALKLEHAQNTEGLVTLSAGLGCLQPEENSSYRQLIELADQSLYVAKRSGRNRAVALKAS
jgi:diguanylate cyclase (GGDEF)-like protein